MRKNLGAFCPWLDLRLAAVTAGPLSGLTFAVKDVFDVRGVTTGGGNPTWAETHEPATATAPAVLALLEAGADLVGKTVADELAFSLIGHNTHYGAPVNPKAPDRLTGGSSSGSASAVAGNAADTALGTDTAGSVRLPASLCGLFGFRPTQERISVAGVLALAPTFDTVGWFARDAATLARVGHVLLGGCAGKPERPRGLRLVEDAFAHADPAVRTALIPAVDGVMAALGAARDVTLSSRGLDTWAERLRIILGREAWSTHGAWITAHRPVFAPDVAEQFAWAATVTAKAAAEAAAFRARVADDLDRLLADGSLLCLPTLPATAPYRHARPDELATFRLRSLALLCIASLAGLPQVTLPLAEADGCPVGLSLIARRGHDHALLAAAEWAAESAL
ncbi:MAG TPA: amidase [Azospirillaceae bacterium]|nr:amidase [Azospirillaceae bacterium]